MKIVCFHNPEEENGYLSNWYSSQFIINDIIFSSMEQFMMRRMKNKRIQRQQFLEMSFIDIVLQMESEIRMCLDLIHIKY